VARAGWTQALGVRSILAATLEEDQTEVAQNLKLLTNLRTDILVIGITRGEYPFPFIDLG
jgi:hypothetical protein